MRTSHENGNGFEVGSELVTASGVSIKITGIRISGMHLIRPYVVVAYEYDDNGRKGAEQNSLDAFINVLAE